MARRKTVRKPEELIIKNVEMSRRRTDMITVRKAEKKDIAQVKVLLSEVLELHAWHKIGRASCRERV